MFDKILIANRGEIACRVIRTARRMGVKTVAVYSEADANAKHVALADEAVLIGPPPAAQSYLDIERIVAACRETGAGAVHPGYGFLSERAEFAQALADAGVVFIGPGPRAIEIMGDKITSKKFATEAGVSTVPGHMGIVEDADEAVRIAEEVGLPVMLKASAGGGGKGMRVAFTSEEVREGFERAQSEAASSFGDDRVFIERFITDPRHIEIQVLADSHGNCVYLGERECSIQRRNQKVLEEAPSPFLDAATRRAMGAQSVALAKAIGYQGAGTVEFIVDGDRNFFFLEMNTRLQVEHPVTELVTGYDLVEHMLRVAAGERLAIEQDEVVLNGWAIEARVYAEEPERGFLPSTGRLIGYHPPEETDDGTIVRVDDGVQEGSEISIYYDPMIAKLCTWGPDRDAAIDTMTEALDGFAIDGVGNNLGFLNALMTHQRWREGRLSTSFIDEEFPNGFSPTEPDENRRRKLAGIAVYCALVSSARSGLDVVPGVPLTVIVNDHQFDARVGTDRLISVDGVDLAIDSVWRTGDPVWRGTIDGEPMVARIRGVGGSVVIEHRGSSVRTQVLAERVAKLLSIMPEQDDASSANELLCPMPGTVVSIAVEAGQKVSVGDTLAVVEAMKMENVLRAERDGTIATVDVKPGDGLAVDQRILAFEPA